MVSLWYNKGLELWNSLYSIYWEAMNIMNKISSRFSVWEINGKET